jgi:hypothetical protein
MPKKNGDSLLSLLRNLAFYTRGAAFESASLAIQEFELLCLKKKDQGPCEIDRLSKLSLTLNIFS